MLTSSTLICSEVALAEKVWEKHSDIFTACHSGGTLFLSGHVAGCIPDQHIKHPQPLPAFQSLARPTMHLPTLPIPIKITAHLTYQASLAIEPILYHLSHQQQQSLLAVTFQLRSSPKATATRCLSFIVCMLLVWSSCKTDPFPPMFSMEILSSLRSLHFHSLYTLSDHSLSVSFPPRPSQRLHQILWTSRHSQRPATYHQHQQHEQSAVKIYQYINQRSAYPFLTHDQYRSWTLITRHRQPRYYQSHALHREHQSQSQCRFTTEFEWKYDGTKWKWKWNTSPREWCRNDIQRQVWF